MEAAVTRRASPSAEPVGGELPAGFLAGLPRTARTRLLADAIRINVAPGSVVYRDNERPRVMVVVRGLLRAFVSSPDGRQVTVRYIRDGDVAGLALVVGGPGPMSIQAMTSALVLSIRVERLRALLATDPEVARACAEELARQLYQAFHGLSGQAFLSVRQRIAFHLLNLLGTGKQLVVQVHHEELAEAIGSIREVVTRNLHGLRDDGLIELSREGITIVDPIGLAREIGDTVPPGSQPGVPKS